MDACNGVGGPRRGRRRGRAEFLDGGFPTSGDDHEQRSCTLGERAHAVGHVARQPHRAPLGGDQPVRAYRDRQLALERDQHQILVAVCVSARSTIAAQFDLGDGELAVGVLPADEPPVVHAVVVHRDSGGMPHERQRERVDVECHRATVATSAAPRYPRSSGYRGVPATVENRIVTGQHGVDQLSREVRVAAAGAADHVEYRAAVLDAIHDVVPFDAGCIATTDPATTMPTSAVSVGLEGAAGAQRFAELEYRPDNSDSFARLATEPLGVRALSQASDHRASPRFVELIEPLGFHDELRIVMRDAVGSCWAVAALMRGPGRTFSDRDVRVIAPVVEMIADGQRAALIRGALTQDGDADGPAVVIIGADGGVESATEQALKYLRRVQPARSDEPWLTLPAQLAARRAAAGLRGTSRVRLPGGSWLVLRAARSGAPDRAKRFVVTMEPARPPEVVRIAAAAFGFTPREAEIFEHVLAGRTSIDIARRLFISPHTVQDHLKKIFVKAQVNSRKELTSRIFFGQYAPRIGSQVAADGWFVD